MATAGLDVRWPVLFSTTSSTHVLEPVAQIFARPDAHSDELTVLNEDARSFVFDATTLFERDKFSGYDRIEGGTRANLGFRYAGTYGNGWATNAIFGQSYHLAGRNSFASPDVVNAGAYSGLDTDTSDYVGLVGFAAPFGLSASVSTRLDRTRWMRRGALRAAYATARPPSAPSTLYPKQPLYGFDVDRPPRAALGKLTDTWRVFAGDP